MAHPTWPLAVLAAITLCAARASGATTVTYAVALVENDTWQYSYTVTNLTPGLSIEEFSVFFDRDKYRDLAIVDSPASWDSIVVQPDLLLPDDGFLDALATGGALALGNTQGGFVVQFTWLGTGTPGEQPFAVVDPNSFATLYSGSTTPVPLPAVGWIAGLGGLIGLRWRRRNPNRRVAPA